jgi:hypothetical protein
MRTIGRCKTFNNKAQGEKAMKRLLLISLLVIFGLAAVSGLFAQATVTIGEGTAVNTTTGSPTPYGTYFKNFHQQYLLRASEIQDAGGGNGNINSISFNVENLNTISAMPNFTIKLKQTTQTELTTTFEVGEYTTVWNAAEFTPVAGWNLHTFTTPFNWNGTSNIIVDIITTLIPGAYTQNASVFYTPTTYNSSLRYQSDTVDAATSLTGTLSMNRCNIRFNMAALVVTTPPNPAVLASPANGATLVTLATTLNWISGGGVPSGYKLSFGTNNPPTNILNNSNLGMVNTYDPPGNMLPATTYYWKVTPFNAVGDAPNCPVWSFTTHGDPTVTTLPYSQTWDLITPPAYPFDWTTIVQTTTTGPYVNTVTTSPHSTPNCVGMYNSSDAASTLLLVGPQIGTALNVNSIRVKFWAKGSAAYHLLVGVMTDPTDPATFVTVQDVNAISNWNEYIVGLTSYTGAGRYIAFKHASTAAYQTIYVDDISYELIAPNDLGATTITGNTTPSVNAASTYTIGLQNWGTASQSTYTVKLMSGTTQLASVAGPTLAAGATGSVQISYTPTTEGPMSIFGKVVLTGDANPANDQTAPMNITVMPAGMAVVTIGTGDLAEGVPWEFYYKNSLFETLYYPTEIGMFGNITAVTFYNNFVTDLPAKPVKLWLGSTQLADLSGGWILPDQLTLVYDGTVNFPSGINTITVPLQTPFSYSGGNLVLYANRPMDTAYFSSSDNFSAQTVGTNRALKLVSDSTVYDPAAPGAAGTLSGTFPKTTLHMTPLSPDPLFVVNPASYNYNTVLMNTTTDKVFSIMNAGGGTLNVSAISISGSPFFTLQSLPTLPANLATGQTAPFTVRYNPTAAGTHTATVTITDNRMVHTVQITGTSMDATIYTMPYSQNFDAVTAPALPLGWGSIYQATGTTSGYVKTVTSSPQSAPNCVAMYNPTDIATTAILVSQPLSATLATNSIRVKFWGKGSTYSVKVGVMSNPNDATTFQEVQTVTLTSAWAQYAVPLTPYTGTGKYIAFKHANNAVGQTIYLDDVSYETIAPNDLAALTVTGNATPSVGAATNYTVNVFNNGTASQSTYTVKLFNSSNVELASAAGTTIAAGATVGITLAWTPTTEGPQSIYGKVILAGDVNTVNDQTPNLNLTVMPQGILTVTIGDGSQNARMPIDMFYKNSVYQTIYYPDEIGLIGNISAVTLYNNFVTTTLVDKPTKIWMGLTTQADLSAGWIPSSSMTLVFDGTMTYPAGENSIVFPLTSIFPYTGGNLVIMWNRPMDTVYFSSSDYFKCQTVGTNRARNIFSDTTVYDPAAMTGGTLTGQFPKTTLTLTPITGDPVFMVTPASKNYGTVLINNSANQNFNIMNAGGGTLTINSITISGSPMYSLQNMPTLPANLTTGQSVSVTGRYNPTAVGTHAATITITDNLARSYTINVGRSDGSRDAGTRIAHTVALTGTCIDTTINTLPYLQAFDTVTAPALPVDWLSLVQSTATALVQTYTTTPHTAPNTAGMTNSSDANATAILIAPPLGNAIATNTTRVKFWGRSSSANYPLSVGIMSNATNATTYTEIQNIALTTTWTEYVVSFSGYTGTGKHVAFKHGLGGTSRLLYIDDVMIEVTPTNDLAATVISGNASPTAGSPSIYNVTVVNWGTAPQSTYSVKLFSSDGTELATAAGLTVGPGATIQVPVTWSPAAQGPITIYGKVVLTGDQNNLNDQTPNLVLSVLPSGTFAVTIGTGDQLGRIPVDMYYKNSLFETLYYPSEMGNFIGQLNGVQFYNNFVTATLQNMPTKVWIGTTTQADLSTGYIPSTNLTLVFDGTVNYPAGENTITIPFSTPYLYLNGENLVLMVNRPMDTVYYSSSDRFQTQTDATHAARALNSYSDTVTQDPAAPPTATASGVFPKTTFLGIPGGVGHINGTVVGAGNLPLEGVEIQITNTTYSATTNAQGQFQIPNVLPANYSISFAKYGYNTHTQNITLSEDQTLTLNITMTQMAMVNVTGTIIASDTGNGLSGATISLTGYQNYNATTTATGTFTIPSVYANQAYSYTILSAGYTTASGTINVAATNHNMGTITLNEVAYAPFGVVASLNDTQTSANINWQAPDPTAVDITESFEAATFPPATWTQVITNTGPANTAGIYPTWCSFGSTTYNAVPAVPADGVKQAGLWWSYDHQDEWLITPAFNCPPAAHLRFSTFVYRGSLYNDHYYVKISTNGGTDWTVLWDATAQTGGYTTNALQVSLNLETYGGQQIKIAFHAEDPPTNDGLWYGWYIDNIIIGNQASTMHFSAGDLTAKSAAGNTRANIGDPGLSRAAMQQGFRSEPVASDIISAHYADPQTRVMTGYKVWRLQAGQEANPNVWVMLTPDVITSLSYVDTTWGTLPNGTYRWAVKAIYTAGVASVPALSNPIIKALEYGNVVGVVRKPNTQPLAGAVVSAGGFSATTNSVGAYSLALPVGTYTVTCTATGYQTMNFDNINISANQNTTLNINMLISANEDEIIPVTATALNGNFPNPFNPETVISYSLKDAGDVRLEIYNLKGQRIRSLVNGRQNTGNYRVLFDARDDNGRQLGSGIYLYRLTTGGYTSTRKMMLME